MRVDAAFWDSSRLIVAVEGVEGGGSWDGRGCANYGRVDFWDARLNNITELRNYLLIKQV